MADETSALKRRHEQLKRWQDSDTSKELGVPSEKNRKVKFQDGCIFLAACSSGDTDEVTKLLEQGADINTANIDGLTALHQACIDDNLDMVAFLVDNGADVDVCDNEGWTPLHATASCGFCEIARYLIRKGANVAAVNNDGDLPIDICEDEEMEKLLQEEMNRQGVDADAARHEEEDRMLEDAKQWLNTRVIKEKKHSKTGASALHVASAKGYIKVMYLLIQAGVDINAQDNDGWTPLHAAAHWGQEEACKILVDSMCDMELKNNNGQTAFDVADSVMVKILEDLKKKQVQLRDKQQDIGQGIIQTKGPLNKRRHSSGELKQRSSVTRMSVDQKQSVVLKTVEQERAALEAAHIIEPKEDDKSSSSEGEASEPDTLDTERQNEINRKTQESMQLPEREGPVGPSMPGPLRTVTMPKIDEVSESSSPSLPSTSSVKNGEERPFANRNLNAIEGLRHTTNTTSSSSEVSSWRAGLRKTGSTSLVPEALSGRSTGDVLDRNLSRSASSPRIAHDILHRYSADNDRLVSGLTPRRPASTSAMLTAVTTAPSTTPSTTPTAPAPAPTTAVAAPTPTTAVVALTPTPTTPAPASTPASTTTTESKDKYSSTYGRSYPSSSPYRILPSNPSSSSSSSYKSAYVPYYRREQEKHAREQEDRHEVRSRDTGHYSLLGSSSRYAGLASLTSPTSSTTPATTITASTITTTTATTSVTSSLPSTVTTPTTSVFRRSYEPPKRDEETETQRKARAKKARETRRSTQGVTLEDIEKAEEVLRSTKDDKDKDQKGTDTVDAGREARRTASAAAEPAKETSEDRTHPASESTTDDSTSYTRRRPWSERKEEENKGTSRTDSFRRSRENQDLSSGTSSLYSDSSSPYTSRRDRNALSTSDMNSSSPTLSASTGSTGITRSASLRSTLRNGELDSAKEEESKKDAKDDKNQEQESSDKKEKSAIRAKRVRRERRSTGIVKENEEDKAKDKENKEDSQDDKKKETETSGGSRYTSRYGSSSDVPSSDRYSGRDRPSSYSEYSRSAPALDTDFKKLYDEEKLENERLRKELEQTKRELRDAKNELDRLMKKDAAPAFDASEKRERRALERKVSEMEEELKKFETLKADFQRLKDENGALIRVISKLSK